MELLDDIQRPRGREQITLRPAWLLRKDDGQTQWVFVQEYQGKVWITGYPVYPVVLVTPAQGTPNPVAGAVAGGGVGMAVGAALGGPPGALLGGLLGLLVGVGTTNKG